MFCIACKQQTLEEIYKESLIDREIVKNYREPELQIQQVLGNQVLFENGDIYIFERVSDMKDKRKSTYCVVVVGQRLSNANNKTH